jgi:putative transcriptional regulator
VSADPYPQRRPVHHFPEELLLDHATGALPEGEAVLVATHLALCHECRAAAVDLEAIGGALLSAVDPVPLAPDALNRVLARIDAGEVPPAQTGGAAAKAAGSLPRPLHAYLGGGAEADLATLAWQPLADGVDQALLRPLWAAADGTWPPGVQVSLVRLAPGAVAPQHTHLGIEATVIVQGGFADQFGQYERGDAWIVDASVDHAPVALPGDPCLCLVYQDAPLKLTG